MLVPIVHTLLLPPLWKIKVMYHNATVVRKYKYWIYHLYEEYKHGYTLLDGLPEGQLSSRVYV